MTTLDQELAFARELAEAAGKVLLRHFGTGIDVQMKGWADPVTVADRESEALIGQAIAQRFPNDGINGEEDGLRAGTSGRVWLVDPLDGTANYSGGMPIFAVVLTLIDEHEPNCALLNVTHDPIRRETFYAVRGQGAYLSDTRTDARIQAGQGTDLARALTHIHFARQRPIWEETVELARRITAVAPHARNIGSTALAQAYVACGRLDAHVKAQSGDYDVIGGNLLVTEAGGLVTDLDGNPWRFGGSLLAACPSIHPRLLQIVRARE